MLHVRQLKDLARSYRRCKVYRVLCGLQYVDVELEVNNLLSL